MRQRVNMSLAVLLVGSSLLFAEDRKGPAPMERLAQGVDLIGRGTYDQALTHILWCFDQGAVEDVEFKPVRESTVIDALALLVEVHPPTITALKARRDTALAQAGSPPKISPAFYDVLALNRALGEDTMSDELIRNAVSAGSIKTFRSTTPAPKKPLVPVTAKSMSPEVKKAAIRAEKLSQESLMKNQSELRQSIAKHREDNAKAQMALTSDKRIAVAREKAAIQTLEKAAIQDREKAAIQTLEKAAIQDREKAAIQTLEKAAIQDREKAAIAAELKEIDEALEVLRVERKYIDDVERWALSAKD